MNRLQACLLVAWILPLAADAEVVRDGVATGGSVRHSPYDSPAAGAVRPSDRRAAPARSVSEHGRVDAMSPSGSSRSTQALRPGEAQSAGAINPSEHRAEDAMRPGETRTREIYNPRRYGAAGEAGVVRSGPAAGGSVRQPSSVASSASYSDRRSGHTDLSLGSKGALPPGVSAASSNWYRQRTINRTVFEALDCGRLRYIEHEGETFRLCKGAWVRRFMWGGETSYVAIYPPEGAVLEQLPGEYSKVRVGNTTYVVVHATFYRRVSGLGRDLLEVVRPPLGAVVQSIPKFALEIEPGLFQFDDLFYRSSGSGYRVVAPPA